MRGACSIQPIFCRGGLVRHAWAALLSLLALCWLAVPSQAQAQINQYTNTATGAINDVTCGGTVLDRTFFVGTSYTVNDVDIGILLTHTYRSDLRITLRSPLGTTVNVMLNTAGDGDHLNDLFDDEAGTAIASHAPAVTDPQTPAPPPYSHNHRPSAAFTAFDGQNAAGTWTLSICDSVAQDVGNFARADLYISQPPVTFADLSLAKTVSNTNPANGAAISYILTISNSAGSALTASGVTVLDTLPSGFAYTSHAAGGGSTFNPGTGVWAVGTLAPGASRTLTVNGTVTATPGATITNTAQVTASSAADLDSVPNNGINAEDDSAQVSFTVSGVRVAGTPPTLVCPAGTTLHDWDLVSWTAGTTNANYPVTNLGTVNFAIAISGGAFLNNGGFGGLSPARQNAITGGLSPAQFSIAELVDMTSSAGTVITIITLPEAVAGAQFGLFDLDFGAGNFADRATVTGTFSGAPVAPVLTNGVANYVVGNSAFGDAPSANTSSNGNVVVTFTSPVDVITIEYGNHGAAPANPTQQLISIHDINLCRPVANLAVTKISSIISDPVNGGTNPKAIPGAVMQYCITLTNPDSGTARSVVIADTVPVTTTFIPGSIRSGSNCASAVTIEDDGAAGADESDPDGASFASGTIGARSTAIGPTSTRAFIFQAVVN